MNNTAIRQCKVYTEVCTKVCTKVYTRTRRLNGIGDEKEQDNSLCIRKANLRKLTATLIDQKDIGVNPDASVGLKD